VPERNIQTESQTRTITVYQPRKAVFGRNLQLKSAIRLGSASSRNFASLSSPCLPATPQLHLLSVTADNSWHKSGTFAPTTESFSPFPNTRYHVLIISYHIISYQKFIVRPLLREPRPWLHYKSQPNAKTPTKKQKSTNV